MNHCSLKKENIQAQKDYFQALLDIIKPNEFLNICIYLKKYTKNKINRELFKLLLKNYRNKVFNDNYEYDNKYMSFNNHEYNLPKNSNINNKINKL